jgi:hypothetical protein
MKKSVHEEYLYKGKVIPSFVYMNSTSLMNKKYTRTGTPSHHLCIIIWAELLDFLDKSSQALVKYDVRKLAVGISPVRSTPPKMMD